MDRRTYQRRGDAAASPATKHVPPEQLIDTRNIFFSTATRWEDIELHGGRPLEQYVVEGLVTHVDDRRFRVAFRWPVSFVKDVPLDRCPCSRSLLDPSAKCVRLLDFDPTLSFQTLAQLEEWRRRTQFPLPNAQTLVLAPQTTVLFRALHFVANDGTNRYAISLFRPN